MEFRKNATELNAGDWVILSGLEGPHEIVSIAMDDKFTCFRNVVAKNLDGVNYTTSMAMYETAILLDVDYQIWRWNSEIHSGYKSIEDAAESVQEQYNNEAGETFDIYRVIWNPEAEEEISSEQVAEVEILDFDIHQADYDSEPEVTYFKAKR